MNRARDPHKNSLRLRLLLASTLVLAAFVALCGLSLERAVRSAAEQAQQDKLRGLIYALLGAAELSPRQQLIIADFDLPDARLAQPQSGLSAWVLDADGSYIWQAPGTLARAPEVVSPEVGTFQFSRNPDTGDFIAAYGLRWLGVDAEARRFTMILAEDSASFTAQLQLFRTTLWLWLGGTSIGLIVALVLVLAWVLQPIRRLEGELRLVESGAQDRIRRRYPRELMSLQQALNAMIRAERAQQKRYRNALGDLAHSLKTPLAVLRGMVSEPAPLEHPRVGEQVERMLEITQHQLSRAATAGRRGLSEPVTLRPIVDKILSALRKVYTDRALRFDVDISERLRVRADAGDLYEMIGNLLDNAAKWCGGTVRVQAVVDASGGFELMVEDDGPGFPEDARRLLARGARADERMPGQGLGLAAVQEIVSAYEGRLEIERSRLGGANVRVLLPG